MANSTVFLIRWDKLDGDLFRETDSEWNCGDLTPFVHNKIMQLTKYRQRLPTLMRATGKSRNTVKSRLDNMPAGHVLESGGGSKKIYRLKT